MEIFDKKQRGRERILFVNVTRAEACQLIESLATQLRTGSPNGGRAEMFTRDNSVYLTIAVNESKA